MARFLVVLIAVTLAACTPAAKKDEAWVRAEFAKEETKGTPVGELLAALRQGQPDLYDQFIATAGAQILAGKSPAEAGMEARPVFLARFTELAKSAKDEQINGMLEFARDQYRASLEVDPKLCVNIIRGAPDLRLARLPASLSDRELSLMASVFRSGKQDGAPAPMDELQGWMGAYADAHPDVAKGLQQMGNPAPTPEESRAICLANVALMEGLLMEPPEKSARLFRGMLALV